MKPELGARAARIAGLAGVFALVTVLIYFGGYGAAFGRLSDAALFVMILALAPVMGTFYELGGRTPLRPAQVSLISSVLAVLVWGTIQALLISGAVTLEYEAPANGAFAIQAIALIVIGLWVAGADLLAGRWLAARTRWLGVVAGLGVVVFAAGLLLGGVNHPLTYVGGVGYQILLPIWALLLADSWGSGLAGS